MTYQNVANDYTVLIPEQLFIPVEAETASGITITSGDRKIVLYPAEGSYTSSVVRGNAIRYNNVFEGIDYQYTVLGNSVKEDIILLEEGEKNIFSYYLDAKGLQASVIDNTLFLYEKGSDSVADALFVLEAPEMEDAAGEISFGVKLEVSDGGEMYLVTVTADNSWLSAPERVYPVRIDPTAVQVTGSAIRISCVEEGSPNSVIGDNQYSEEVSPGLQTRKDRSTSPIVTAQQERSPLARLSTRTSTPTTGRATTRISRASI